MFRHHGAAYRTAHYVPHPQRRVMADIERCRTAALGGHVEACNRCGKQSISYNSCRNRHCPKCQSLAKEKWLAKRQSELLPVEYFHVVFTVPAAVAEIARANPRLVYGLLFSAVAETLRTLAADPKHLGAEIGFLAVLHTWGQNLLHHPHVHCVVPGGGLGPAERQWVACRPGFFLPVRVLSRLFRRLLLERLRAAHRAGRLDLVGPLTELQQAEAFEALLRSLAKREWVVYAKPPFAGPRQVLDYLARYTHRVALSNDRIEALEDGTVTFRWKDYRQPGQPRRMTLEAMEFIRRFLLHVLPLGFVRIRHYGLLANRHRTANATTLGISHLYQAAGHANVEIMKVLLESGADIEFRNGPVGRTALQEAAVKKRFSAVVLLVEQGADVNARNNNGRTALAYVTAAATVAKLEVGLDETDKATYEKIAEYLRSRGATF